MKKYVSFILASILFIAFPLNSYASTLEEVKNYINKYYAWDIPANLDAAMTVEDVEKTLDPYSAYFTKEEYDKYINAVNQQLVGIGVMIEQHKEGILVVDVIEKGSASVAGIVPGDILISADGMSLVGMTIQEAFSRVTGKEGTTVTIVVKTKSGKEITHVLTREKISLPIVTQKILYGNIGYIRLSSFSNDAGQLVSKTIREQRAAGVKSFIFDLRNNGGGFVTAAQDIIGLFPNSLKATQLHYKGSKEQLLATKQSIVFDDKVKLLVNNQSASASEMTAAAVRDYHSATIYGQKTYGKGSMQTFFSLSNGDIFKLTIAEFRSPFNQVINKKGVQPHFVTAEGKELEKAHLDALLPSLKNYKQLKSTANTSLTQKFVFTISSTIPAVSYLKQVKLIELGGTAIPFTFNKIDNSHYSIAPKLPFEKKKQYLLTINSSAASNGAYMVIQK